VALATPGLNAAVSAKAPIAAAFIRIALPRNTVEPPWNKSGQGQTIRENPLAQREEKLIPAARCGGRFLAVEPSGMIA
jgi:hypothetical protein